MTNVPARVADVIVESLRAGEVPQEGLEHFATGIEKHAEAVERDLPRIADRRGRYRFVRGEYGSGKTFFLRYLGARARAKGFASAYVRVSYPEAPLHQPIALYRAAASGLGRGSKPAGALQDVVEQWLFEVGERVSDPTLGKGIPDDDGRFPEAVAEEVRTALGPVADVAPAMAQGLAAYARVSLAGDHDTARGLLQWLGGDDRVAAKVKREALQTGKLANLEAIPMLAGLSEVVRQAGYRGLVVLLDEVERLVRLPRLDARTAGLQTLQNWLGALDAGQLPGVLLVVAGTASFFDSPRGIPQLPPLQQRIGPLDDGGFPDLDAIQLKLPPFDQARLVTVGTKVRDLYETLHPGATARCPDTFVEQLAAKLSSAFHGHVEVTPRRFLRELIGVLGRLRQYADYDPAVHYAFDARDASVAFDLQEQAALEGRDVRATETADQPTEIDL